MKKKSTVYKYVNKRSIPHYKRGKTLYFYEDELLNWKRKTKESALERHYTTNPQIIPMS